MNTRLVLATITLTALCAPARAEDGLAGPFTVAAPPAVLVQAAFELLPMGSTEASSGNSSLSVDNQVAYGISGTFDVALGRYVRIGVAPRLIFNVNEKDPPRPPPSVVVLVVGGGIDSTGSTPRHTRTVRGRRISSRA